MGDITESKKQFIAAYRASLAKIQNNCEKQDQVEMPVTSQFCGGVYLRQIFMPKGAFVIGKTHKTEHFNIVLSGSANVMIDGEIQFIAAPFTFKSGKGVKKVLFIKEDMLWATTHATEETDLKIIEDQTVYTDEEEKKLLDQFESELKQLE